MKTLSILILTYNNEETLERTLKSVENLAPVIIIDSGSTDNTLEIASQYKAQVFVNPMESFSKQRNFALSKAQTDTVLFLDSDEAINSEFYQYLKESWPKTKENKIVRVVRTEYLLGKEIKTGHGRSAYQERLMVRAGLEYRGIVHESPYWEGLKFNALPDDKKNSLPPDLRILHNPACDTRIMLRRLVPYSNLKANEKIRSGSKAGKTIVLLAFVGTLFQVYFRSIKEGDRGFILSTLEALHRCIVKLLIFEESIEKKDS